jgi:hydroxymethylpyrimidine pyrophosphatase-like HAD family hydrolase
VPAVTLCTGRQEPYVEVLMQAIAAYLPGIYENGCGLYFPDRYRFVEHPSITDAVREALAEARGAVQRSVVVAGQGYLQPGKEVSMSVYPLPGTSVQQLHRRVAGALTDHGELFTIQVSASCVDVTPRGVDKGTGVKWLADETGIAVTQMGGIGDSPSDLRFLRLTGRSAAPANARAEVKAAVDQISRYTDGAGVVDILQRWCTEE